MSALQHPLHGDTLRPAPKNGVDRKALREQISKRYEHTLRRLGQ